MSLYRRGAAPVDVTLGDRGELRVTLGDIVIWDGTTPVTIQAPASVAVGSMPDPTTAVGVQPVAPPLLADAALTAPEIRAGATTSGAATLAVAEVPGPVLSAGITAEAPPMAGIATVPTPGVGETAVEAVPAIGTASMPTPIVAAGVTAPGELGEAVGRIPLPELATGATVAPAAMAATASMPAPEASTGVTYTDNFNRASLGADWAAVGIAPVIADSAKAQAGTGGGFGAMRSYVGRRVSAVTADNHRSAATLVMPTGTSSLTLGVGLWVRGTTAGDRVEAILTPSSATIYTRIGATSTSRATQTGLSIAAGALVELVASGTTYTVYVDGAPVVSWTDSGGVIAIGASTRSVGITLNSNKTFASVMTYGWALDDWIGRDG